MDDFVAADAEDRGLPRILAVTLSAVSDLTSFSWYSISNLPSSNGRIFLTSHPLMDTSASFRKSHSSMALTNLRGDGAAVSG